MTNTKLRSITVAIILIVSNLAYAQAKPGWTAAPDPLPRPAKIPPTFNIVVPTRLPFADATASPQNPAILAFNTNDIQTHDWETWDLSTRKRIGGAKGTKLEVGIPSPDGLYLLGAASIHNRGAAEIWSLQQNGKLLHKLTNPQGGDFVPIGFAVNDQVITMHSVGFQHIFTAWNLKTGQMAWEFQTDRWLFANAAVSPGGRFLAYPSKGDVIKLHDLSTNKPAGELPPATGNDPNARPDNNLQAIAFSPDGAVVAARYRFTANRVGVWDLSNGKLLLDVKISEGPRSEERRVGEGGRVEVGAVGCERQKSR